MQLNAVSRILTTNNYCDMLLEEMLTVSWWLFQADFPLGQLHFRYSLLCATGGQFETFSSAEHWRKKLWSSTNFKWYIDGHIRCTKVGRHQWFMLLDPWLNATKTIVAKRDATFLLKICHKLEQHGCLKSYGWKLRNIYISCLRMFSWGHLYSSFDPLWSHKHGV